MAPCSLAGAKVEQQKARAESSLKIKIPLDALHRNHLRLVPLKHRPLMSVFPTMIQKTRPRSASSETYYVQPVGIMNLNLRMIVERAAKGVRR